MSDVSMTLRRGEIVAIIGRKGSGKSTLLKILADLHLPVEGSVTRDGVPVGGLDTEAMWRRVARVPQKFAHPARTDGGQQAAPARVRPAAHPDRPDRSHSGTMGSGPERGRRRCSPLPQEKAPCPRSAKPLPLPPRPAPPALPAPRLRAPRPPAPRRRPPPPHRTPPPPAPPPTAVG
ncbi:ATP-binding cassette domain-containing protein [Kitasatospora sp. NPDC056138]|uniref:ATP-binding cassette domain-containing protein n=1 Tax=Kitasatospora sp. NPDC056138 TaxID=3345724 RepID=UPI0035DA3CE7